MNKGWRCECGNDTIGKYPNGDIYCTKCLKPKNQFKQILKQKGGYEV